MNKIINRGTSRSESEVLTTLHSGDGRGTSCY